MTATKQFNSMANEGACSMSDAIAANAVAEFEQALHEAANLHRAYQIARLVPGTNQALTDLYNLMEDARAKVDRKRSRVLMLCA